MARGPEASQDYLPRTVLSHEYSISSKTSVRHTLIAACVAQTFNDHAQKSEFIKNLMKSQFPCPKCFHFHQSLPKAPSFRFQSYQVYVLPLFCCKISFSKPPFNCGGTAYQATSNFQTYYPVILFENLTVFPLCAATLQYKW